MGLLNPKRNGENIENVKKYNEFLLKESSFLQDHSNKYKIIETDTYQEKIKKFVMDMSEQICQDIEEQIKERKIIDNDLERA